MGSFSWLRAETTKERANLTDGDRYKILVPKEFGGGYINDVYYDYGYIFAEDNVNRNCKYVDGDGKCYRHDEFGECDLYGVLAYWNLDLGLHSMVDILKHGNTTGNVRIKGIDIGCYDYQIDLLKYPLKLVSRSYDKTYEECPGRSYGDPDQGFGKGCWSDYPKYYERLKEMEWRVK